VSGAQLVQHWFTACLGAFDALAYPWSCLVCGEEVEGAPFCHGCRAELLKSSGRACARCAMPLGPWEIPARACRDCRGRALGFDVVIALGRYQGTIHDLCLKLKHESNAWLAPWLVDLLLEARAGVLRAENNAVVVPVPLHWKRQWQRRYNQADALAAHLAHRLGSRAMNVLRRIVATEPLARKGRIEREGIMHNVFQARRRKSVQGRTVLLVDDILTTGATCGAAARALKSAGASRVVVVVVGRAEGKP